MLVVDTVGNVLVGLLETGASLGVGAAHGFSNSLTYGIVDGLYKDTYDLPLNEIAYYIGKMAGDADATYFGGAAVIGGSAGGLALALPSGGTAQAVCKAQKSRYLRHPFRNTSFLIG